MNRLTAMLDRLNSNHPKQELKSEKAFEEFKTVKSKLLQNFDSLDKTIKRLNKQQLNNLNLKK